MRSTLSPLGVRRNFPFSHARSLCLTRLLHDRFTTSFCRAEGNKPSFAMPPRTFGATIKRPKTPATLTVFKIIRRRLLRRVRIRLPSSSIPIRTYFMRPHRTSTGLSTVVREGVEAHAAYEFELKTKTLPSGRVFVFTLLCPPKPWRRRGSSHPSDLAARDNDARCGTLFRVHDHHRVHRPLRSRSDRKILYRIYLDGAWRHCLHWSLNFRFYRSLYRSFVHRHFA